ncbi:uncharacterized protein MELLADRAFT_108456 [Melampsora larici-populina 98AG31]|uniref:Uncharacterized protein n=1 Tax=Melampsora larici-populina (strain 98AG31 / pathotype 3-4-7) TaxID=747676 RepID=F4RT58_MELLP|nr:uncharacterized protein MELLADRAFT_108456 [Melampsora larici-populina 98AG31]EGG04488.1 hypothetical protein MELLADRAFT_108456 [Melampsora larici-populina 98AG31]
MARTKKSEQSTPLTFKEREELNKSDIKNRLEKSTVAKYTSGYRRFLKFCKEHHHAGTISDSFNLLTIEKTVGQQKVKIPFDPYSHGTRQDDVYRIPTSPNGGKHHFGKAVSYSRWIICLH